MVQNRSSKVCQTGWMAKAAVFFADASAQPGRSRAGSTCGARDGWRWRLKGTRWPKTRILLAVLALMALVPGVRAQTRDWHKVEMLEPGSWLHVKADRKYFCVLEGVAHDALICEVHLRRSFATTTISIPREQVREVRKVPNLDDQRKDGWIGAGFGAAAGAVTAGSTARTNRGANAFFGGLAGAAAGYIAGEFVPLFQMRGKLIYKR